MSKPIEHTTPSVNPNINYGLWVIMICQYRFINCNKGTILVRDVNNGRDCVCGGGAGVIWEIPEPNSHFCWELKTALKKLSP